VWQNNTFRKSVAKLKKYLVSISFVPISFVPISFVPSITFFYGGFEFLRKFIAYHFFTRDLFKDNIKGIQILENANGIGKMNIPNVGFGN
jgi:hypothetical protein